MKRILLAFSILLSATLQLAAQTAPPTNLSGEELKTWLRTNWYDSKHRTLSYSTARGKMYNYIDNYSSLVSCVYSGYQESKPYSETNTSTTMANINCEHTIPQSWFSSNEPMVSDIHHLYPTVIQWNSDRGSDPFAEISDNQTTKWIRGNSSQTTIPTTNIDEYSEDTNTQFEPREDHKGNLARSVFYFYTMYPSQAGSISRIGDINTLYQWHIKDPVDDRERERNRRVEVAQGNLNPYIDYPELVAKAWNLTPVNCSPATQVANLSISQRTTTSLTLNWTNGSGDRRLIVVKEASPVAFTPSGAYSGINADFSAATDQGNGQRIVYYNSGSSVTITGLKANTVYYMQAFESCSTGNTYNTTAAPAISATTPDYACAGVPTAVVGLTSANITQTGFNLTWTNGTGDGRIVVIRKDEAPTFVPQAGTVYNGAAASYTSAATLTDGSKLLYSGTGSEVTVIGLQTGSLYFVQVYEMCSNGNQYATTAPALAVTTTAANTPPTGNGNVLVMQDFNGTANDGWVVTSGFSNSTTNTGLPDGQRVRTGASLQVSNATKEVMFADVNVAGKQDVYLELYNSSVSVTTGNGFDTGDYLEVYVALNGADFSATPEIKITGNASDNNIRYGMDGTATITTAAGTLAEKVFTEKLTSPNVLAVDKAPSILRVTIPNGTTSVKAKIGIKNNSSNEVWNIEDVALYSATTSTDCDENVLEGHAGENKTIYSGQSVTIGAVAETGYTYSWFPAAGLSDATAANPTLTLTTPGTYVYTVTATKDGCTSTDDVTVTVQAITPPTAASIAICAGESATLQVANPDAEMTYKWYDAETGTTSLATGATFTTSPLTASTLYYVEAVNAAGATSARTKVTVTVGTPAAATITGPATICAGETVTFVATGQVNATDYSWNVPPTWSILSGVGTAQISVRVTDASGEVSLAVANNCGQSAPATLAVTVNAVPDKPVVTQKGNQLTASIAGAVYEWTKDGEVVANATEKTITITESGNYKVRAHNGSACYSVSSDVFQAVLQPTAIEDELASGIVVVPNPAPGKFSIYTAEPLQHTEVVITNMIGSVVYRASVPVMQESMEVNLSRLPAGFYLVQLQAKKVRVVRKVLLTK
ncbi:endonuclease [Pontibacter sp. KCTC 32443]|uniref:endonuclease n=1 Tax=Pontibacter TaxID=323449 RepID=UPI00164D6A14|nr:MULTISPECIES: endonuclease [Pontibacter]MBC5775741.1 endonuclease [Pontibacter sp. KCTC 32443]